MIDSTTPNPERLTKPAGQAAPSARDTPSAGAGREGLAAAALSVGYGDRLIIHGLDIELPVGGFTAIIGPNACGKSTLLRTLARLLKPRAGTVVLDGRELRSMRTGEIARRLALLPQAPVSPEGITVEDLVSRGRYAHQSVLSQWSRDDRTAVEAAMAATRVTELANRPVDELSGGQRQRVWIALTLAQQSATLLLDEPTTYLDITHQIEILELVRSLRDEGRTVIAVLHDLGHAARYADHIVAMRDGRIVREGSPQEVITAQTIAEVFGLDARVIADPDTGTPVVLPRSPLRGD